MVSHISAMVMASQNKLTHAFQMFSPITFNMVNGQSAWNSPEWNKMAFWGSYTIIHSLLKEDYLLTTLVIYNCNL